MPPPSGPGGAAGVRGSRRLPRRSARGGAVGARRRPLPAAPGRPAPGNRQGRTAGAVSSSLPGWWLLTSPDARVCAAPGLGCLLRLDAGHLGVDSMNSMLQALLPVRCSHHRALPSINQRGQCLRCSVFAPWGGGRAAPSSHLPRGASGTHATCRSSWRASYPPRPRAWWCCAASTRCASDTLGSIQTRSPAALPLRCLHVSAVSTVWGRHHCHCRHCTCNWCTACRSSLPNQTWVQVDSLPLFPPCCPQMAPELLPVLINALSEQGAFQQGGQPVPTTRETS